MKQDNRIRKRCRACGHEVWAARRERVCKQKERNAKGFNTGYRCPGKLVALKALRRAKRLEKAHHLPPIPKGLGIGHVLSEQYQQAVVQRAVATARAKADKEYAAALDKQKEWATESKRIANLCRKWNKEVRRLKRRVAMTEEQFAAERMRMAVAAQVGAVKKRLAKSAGIVNKQKEQP